MTKGKINWEKLLNIFITQFNTKSGAVGEIEVYKANEVDYVENSARIAKVLVDSDEVSLPEGMIEKYEDEWSTADEVFDYIHEQALKDIDLSMTAILSYDTTGFTGSSTTYHLFRYDNKAIFWESVDGFTPGVYVIRPVTQSTDLTNLVLIYFLREGLPSVGVASLDLNPNWIDQQEFKDSLVNRLTDVLDDEAKNRWLISHIKETLDSSTDDRLIDIMGASDLTRLRESLEQQDLTRRVLEMFIGALFKEELK